MPPEQRRGLGSRCPHGPELRGLDRLSVVGRRRHAKALRRLFHAAPLAASMVRLAEPHKSLFGLCRFFLIIDSIATSFALGPAGDRRGRTGGTYSRVEAQKIFERGRFARIFIDVLLLSTLKLCLFLDSLRKKALRYTPSQRYVADDPHDLIVAAGSSHNVYSSPRLIRAVLAT